MSKPLPVPTYISWSIDTGDCPEAPIRISLQSSLSGTPYSYQHFASASSSAEKAVKEYREQIKRRIACLGIEYNETIRRLQVLTDESTIYIGGKKQETVNQLKQRLDNLQSTTEFLWHILDEDEEFLNALSNKR